MRQHFSVVVAIAGTVRIAAAFEAGCSGPASRRLAEIAARLEPHPDATMLRTAISEAVELYEPSKEAAIFLESASDYQVLILSPEGYDYVGGRLLEPG